MKTLNDKPTKRKYTRRKLKRSFKSLQEVLDNQIEGVADQPLHLQSQSDDHATILPVHITKKRGRPPKQEAAAIGQGVPTLPANDAVNHPSHYTSHPSGIECITITEGFDFVVGNAIKYLWRAGLKGGKIEDLHKARWYVERAIANAANQ